VAGQIASRQQAIVFFASDNYKPSHASRQTKRSLEGLGRTVAMPPKGTSGERASRTPATRHHACGPTMVPRRAQRASGKQRPR
jgi:hypothetical protein